MASRLKLAGGAGAITALGLAALTLVGGFEGKRNLAYQDIVGVWTVCYGETRGVRRGDYRSDAECRDMLSTGLVEFEQGMRKCLRRPDDVPDGAYLAMLSLAWNIGQGAFCKSSVVRHANDNDLPAACNAISLYNRAGGRVVEGLKRRREQERALCLKSLRAA